MPIGAALWDKLEPAMIWVGPLWDWLTDWTTLRAIGEKVVPAIVLAALTYLWHKVPSLLYAPFDRGRRRTKLDEAVQRYRENLERHAFRVHHSWMREGQTLDDILVPAIVIGPSKTSIEGLYDVVQRLFSQPEGASPTRLAVIGAPGSGKSVALRIAARQSWAMLGSDGLPRHLPVLLTFADLRKTDFDLEKALAASVRSRGFPAKTDAVVPTPEAFVAERLGQGRLLVLLDGLDELKLEDRREAVRALVTVPEQYPTLPLILSCRSVPFREHESALGPLGLGLIEMADFIPASIRQFVTQWRFDPPKSSPELLRILEDRPHLRELAKNPLALTIITFLYSLPKYRLPDNRAQFYEVCARALLEEWDQCQNAARANRFDRPHKEDLLSRLAYEHLCGPSPERDIEQATVREVFADEMANLGLSRGANVEVLAEIQDNSGLLVPLPPTGLRFPHQTFLEYFAARYLLGHHSVQKLLTHFAEDPRRWREVMLLYCGLATKADDTAQIVEAALARNDIELCLELVTNARAVPAAVAERALAAVSDCPVQQPTPVLVSHLGSLAANAQSVFSERAAELLQACLDRGANALSDKLLQAVILALLRRPGTSAMQAVLENLNRLGIQRILPILDENAILQLVTRLCQEQLSKEQWAQMVESLRLSKLVRPLFEIMQNSSDPHMTHVAAVALARLSNERAFWDLLDDAALPEPRVDPTARDLLARWTWPEARPTSRRGQLLVFTLASHVAESMFDGVYVGFNEPKPDLHPAMSFLAHGVAYERRYRGVAFARPDANMLRAAPQRNIPRMRPRYVLSLWTHARHWRGWFRVCHWDGWPWSMFALMTSLALPILAAYGRFAHGATVHVAPDVAVIWCAAAGLCFLGTLGAVAAFEKADRAVGVSATCVFGPPGGASWLHDELRGRGQGTAVADIAWFVWIAFDLVGLACARSTVFFGLVLVNLVATAIFWQISSGFSPFLPGGGIWGQQLLEWRLSIQLPAGAVRDTQSQ